MLDHVEHYDVLTNYDRSKAFYERALAPLGLSWMMEPAPGIGGFGDAVLDRQPGTRPRAAYTWRSA